MPRPLIEVTDASFADQVIASERPVLVDFHATWCGPCRALAPVVEGLAQEYDGKVTVVRIDVDANPVTASRYGVRAIPTLLVFRRGEIVARLVGSAPRAKIDALITHALEEKRDAVAA